METEVKDFFQFLKQNRLDDITAPGEAVLPKKGAKAAVEVTIKTMQCCDNYQRWTPMEVRREIYATMAPLARSLGIPQEQYILIV